jgi:hypothetical protein
MASLEQKINKKLKIRMSHSSEQFRNPIEKSKQNRSNTYIHERIISWPGTGISVKCGGVKLVLF